jgi:hypothetical protein
MAVDPLTTAPVAVEAAAVDVFEIAAEDTDAEGLMLALALAIVLALDGLAALVDAAWLLTIKEVRAEVELAKDDEIVSSQ